MENIVNEEIKRLRVLADNYFFGKSIPVNKEKAFQIYEDGAEQGDVYCQLMLGYMFDFGDGIPADASQAIKWYSLAVSQGDSNAALNLANIYLQERGVSKNIAKGMYYLEMSAKWNNAIAASSLGRQYTNGDGVEKSFEKAKYWIEKAESLGYVNCDTITNLGLMFEERGDDYNAFICFTKAITADPGSTNAQYLYGQYKFFGRGTTKDVADAKMRIQWVVDTDPNDEDAKRLLEMIKQAE